MADDSEIYDKEISFCEQCGEETSDLTYLEGVGWCCPRCYVKYE